LVRRSFEGLHKEASLVMTIPTQLATNHLGGRLPNRFYEDKFVFFENYTPCKNN
jgi:hypothetical protein